MANSPDFVAHALELLSSVGPVEARAMFGGHGVYAGGVMFGLLDDDELFLKTDEACRPRFVQAGCRQWTYVGKTRRMESTSYFRPPDAAHEEPEAMGEWATLSLEAALRLRAAKEVRGTPTGKARPAARRAPPAKASRAPRGKRGGAKAAAKVGAKRSRGRARPR